MAEASQASATGLRVARGADGIAVITIDRPQVHNALDWATMDAFAAAVRELGAELAADAGRDDGLRAVVVAGGGTRAFCAGGDQRALAGYESAADGERLADVMTEALAGLEALPVPVIAAINGYALGGGAEIALACDLRVVDAEVRFGLVQLRLGLTPGWGAGQRLLRLVGYGKALELFLAGERLGAAQLVALGLAAEAAPAGQALDAAMAWAARIAAADPDTVRAVKALLRAGVERPPAEAAAIERALFASSWAGEAHLAALRGFAEEPAR